MADIYKIEMFRHYCDMNMRRFVEKKSGGYVLLEENSYPSVEEYMKNMRDFDINERFFGNEDELKEFIDKNRTGLSCNIYSMKIPEKMPHRDRTIIEFDDNAKYCPNDGETELSRGLVVSSLIEDGIGNLVREYSESACCPVCGCIVVRKPPKELVMKVKSHNKKI